MTITSTYIVQEGDTLEGIAIAEGITLEALQASNPNVSGNTIYTGEVLKIPKSQTTDKTTTANTTTTE